MASRFLTHNRFFTEVYSNDQHNTFFPPKKQIQIRLQFYSISSEEVQFEKQCILTVRMPFTLLHKAGYCDRSMYILSSAYQCCGNW